MKYSDVFKLQNNEGLEDKLPAYKQKDNIKPITIEGTEYLLKNSEYDNLMKILKETNTKLEEIRKYEEGYNFSKYFGISIENASITKLQINDYELKKIPYLENLIQLTKLELGANNISKIEGLEKLNQLTTLNLGINQINKIEGLENLNQLTTLNLYDNHISKIEGLENLNQLTTLYLWRNNLIYYEEYEKAFQELRQKGVEIIL